VSPIDTHPPIFYREITNLRERPSKWLLVISRLWSLQSLPKKGVQVSVTPTIIFAVTMRRCACQPSILIATGRGPPRWPPDWVGDAGVSATFCSCRCRLPETGHDPLREANTNLAWNAITGLPNLGDPY